MIFSKFSDSDVVLGRTNRVSSGFWSTGDYAHSQSALFTSSTQTQITGSGGISDIKSGMYYYNVYNSDPGSDVASQVHFSLAYGDLYGSGSGDANTSSLLNATKAVYSQFKNYLLSPSDDVFSFKTGSYLSSNGSIIDTTSVISGSSIYVISFSTNKFKDRVDEGQLEISLSGSSGKFTFVDDSTIIKSQQDVYNIISGSISDGVTSVYKVGDSVNYNAIGLFYPKTGIVIFNAAALSSVVGIAYDNGITGTYKLNQRALYTALTACNTSTMKVRKSEYIPSRHYFIRIKNQEYNYSNNPSYVYDGSDDNVKGTIKIADFLTDPKTYPTTVGLYDDSNELVAVAKLSQPVQKSFNSEILCRVKLDF